jgi:hypothetical protein
MQSQCSKRMIAFRRGHCPARKARGTAGVKIVSPQDATFLH